MATQLSSGQRQNHSKRGLRRRIRFEENECFDEPESEDGFLVDIMSKRQRAGFRLLVAAWAVGLAVFSLWWFRADHFIGLFKFVLNTMLVTWTLGVPGYFLFFVARMKRVNPRVGLPENWRVAMVTTRAPSEPFEVVKPTLISMLSQAYDHDTWLADEDPTAEVYQWCADHGVQVSTRKGIAEYHRPEWPRRTKCKEGNLAFFYDHYGYQRYDFVVQMDADHVPSDGYLEAMLRPFVNGSVGYVSAPSICDKNSQSSWSARGRLFSEALMHGPLQAGYSDGFAPLCIGSHYAVRTRALREIGGLGPELAEDHSTTLIMNGHGWRGVHAIDAIAHGDGPPTFADCITQEFQWSRSLMIVLLTLLPKYWSRLTWSMRVQFLFTELWYLLFAASMLAGLALPVLAVLWRQPWVEVNYVDFLFHTLPLVCLVIAIVAFLKVLGLLRPTRSPIISWEAALFQIVRWPWVVYGSLMGMVMAIGQRDAVFRVTPKGVRHPVTMGWKVLLPYIAIVIITYLPALLIEDAGPAKGYYFFIILAQVMYVSALFGLVLIHRHEVSKNH